MRGLVSAVFALSFCSLLEGCTLFLDDVPAPCNDHGSREACGDGICWGDMCSEYQERLEPELTLENLELSPGTGPGLLSVVQDPQQQGTFLATAEKLYKCCCKAGCCSGTCDSGCSSCSSCNECTVEPSPCFRPGLWLIKGNYEAVDSSANHFDDSDEAMRLKHCLNDPVQAVACLDDACNRYLYASTSSAKLYDDSILQDLEFLAIAKNCRIAADRKSGIVTIASAETVGVGTKRNLWIFDKNGNVLYEYDTTLEKQLCIPISNADVGLTHLACLGNSLNAGIALQIYECTTSGCNIGNFSNPIDYDPFTICSGCKALSMAASRSGDLFAAVILNPVGGGGILLAFHLEDAEANLWRLLDIAAGQDPSRLLSTTEVSYTAVSFAPEPLDDWVFAAGTETGEVVFFDYTGRGAVVPVLVLRACDNAKVADIAFSPDGNLLFVACDSQQAGIDALAIFLREDLYL